MTYDQQHPITPPPELRRLWAQQAQRISPHDPVEWMQYVAARAAQWGADQELEACRMEIIDGAGVFHIDETNDRVRLAENLRSIRRPKPPSLKQQALAMLDDTEVDAIHYETIRRALEALPDD